MRFLEETSSQRQKSRMVVPGAGGGSVESECLMGIEFQFGKMKEFWRWMAVMIVQQ